MKAPVNRIIPLSTVDGPGARTAVFLQGCNIDCIYCHNPETKRMCIHCGECIKGCPAKALAAVDGKVIWSDTDCVSCDRCIAVCPHSASPKVKFMTAQEIMSKVKRNQPFIRGITVSGGECMLYPEFLTELFQMAQQEGLTCLADSNGMTDFSKYPELLNLCDGVMLDVKAWDSKTYGRLTGAEDNTVVKNNIIFLAEQKRLEEIRIVYIKNLVDAERIINELSEIPNKCIKEIRLKLIAFRNYGVRGELERMDNTSIDDMKVLYEYAQNAGFRRLVSI